MDYDENGDEVIEIDQTKGIFPPLEIPLRNANRQETTEVIAFDPQDLPPAEDVIEVLIDQEATQMRWLRFASAYFRVGRPREAEKILVTVKGEYVPPSRPGMPPQYRQRTDNQFDPDRIYGNDLEGRALVGNALASLYIHFAREQRLLARQNADKEQEVDKPISVLGANGRTEHLQVAQLLARAEALLQTAERYSNTERLMALTLTTRGEIQMEQFVAKLGKGGMSQMEIERTLTVMSQTFQSALDQRPNSMRALFGKASILFQRQMYNEAREVYARAIKTFPGADPGASRVALGLCYYALGQESRAQECFERALELDPKSVDAQVCLAIIEMGLATDAEKAAGDSAQELARNQERARRLRERANDRLRLAYDLDKWNPLLKVHLANIFFYSQGRDYKRIGDLAKEAFNHTTSKQIKAEAYYISARNLHAQGDTRNAATLYSRATDHWSAFPLARYGHAQMELTQTKPDLSAALRAVQAVLDTPEGKDDEDCLLMVGALHRMMRNTEAALQNLRRVTEKNAYRAEAWLQQALIEQEKYRQSLTSAEEAIRCYEKAEKALRFHGEPVPFELYNNLGALKFRVGNYKGALDAFDLAIKERGDEPYEAPGKVKLPMVTLIYNKARALESLSRIEEAEQIYSDLTQLSKHYPGESHVEAQLRLAVISANRGDFESAIEQYVKPLSTSLQKQSVPDYYSFYGDLEIHRAKVAEVASAKAFAESKFKRVLDVSPNDPYARLSTANLLLQDAQNFGKSKEDRQKSEEMIREAARSYRLILSRHPTNVFAANGIGACHALRGRYHTAQLILSKVREFADSICPSAWINLAHVQVHEGAFGQAALLYDQCLKRFFDNRDADLSLYLANARFMSGKYAEARMAVANALKFFPADENLWFASANIDEAEAYQSLEVDPKLRTKASVERAEKSLRRALAVYKWMIAKASALSKARLEQRKDDSGAVISTARKAFKESNARLQVPHTPVPPLVGPPGNIEVSSSSTILLARARVAMAELEGRPPADVDAQLVAKADEEKRAVEIRATKESRAKGCRVEIERALGPHGVRTLSTTATNRLAQLAHKRAEIVVQELKTVDVYFEQQRKQERKAEVERRRHEEHRLEEEKRRREIKEKELAEKKKEEELRAERQAQLAEQNKILQRLHEEEAQARDKDGARRSGRVRVKTQKLRDSEQTRRKGSKKKSKKVDEDSSSSDEDEDEDEEGEEEEEEEVEDKSSSDDSSEEEEEVEDDNDAAIVNMTEQIIKENLDSMLREDPEAQKQYSRKWVRQQVVSRLGESFAAQANQKITDELVTSMVSRLMQLGNETKKPRVKRLKLSTEEDAQEEEVGAAEPTPENNSEKVEKKKSRTIVSDDEDEGSGKGEAPQQTMEVDEEEEI